ncbi:hypothetical protein [Halobacteriovorax sp. JY17]|uniref:hypothetical protein n=1 Tax=Halobacteriovorax sp. JY17 TaxID=2014617 RepID=UPI000C606757|nr:hypothetical protein [Halobacteriovorax sp. JY17]PIK15096.1 MAG: hypothetical protein CES88_12240 [Halobacteriovorax sp. JY17]
MIKLLKDSKSNKVKGVLVNGKKFSVSKDLAHALSIEEGQVIKEGKRVSNEVEELKEELEVKNYYGDSPTMLVDITFDKLNRVMSRRSRVEFKKEIPEEAKESFLFLLEDFLLALNRASYKRHLDYEKSCQKILKESA